MTYLKCMLPVRTCLSTRTDTSPALARAARFLSARESVMKLVCVCDDTARSHVIMVKIINDEERRILVRIMSVFPG